MGQRLAQAEVAAVKTGKKVAVVGSGPAGLACAQQLARAGHDVHVFEKFAKAGGLLRYGIPDFKMEKGIIDRRVAQMEGEGVTFHTTRRSAARGRRGRAAGSAEGLRRRGADRRRGSPRDLPIPGRDLDGVHFAMEFLPQQNRRVGNEARRPRNPRRGKHVVVIGGGDTGSDCVGTSIRQGAKSVTQFEIMPRRPSARTRR
jgi:glutamate synthase (NADPH/NADH) small chain